MDIQHWLNALSILSEIGQNRIVVLVEDGTCEWAQERVDVTRARAVVSVL
jgi:hypothetical protein